MARTLALMASRKEAVYSKEVLLWTVSSLMIILWLVNTQAWCIEISVCVDVFE